MAEFQSWFGDTDFTSPPVVLRQQHFGPHLYGHWAGHYPVPDDFDAEAMIRHYTRGDDEEIADCSQQ